jgi:hypothetical protein
MYRSSSHAFPVVFALDEPILQLREARLDVLAVAERAALAAE